MADLAQLEQAYASLQTIFRNVLGPRSTAVIRRTEQGATLDEVQGEIDAVRAEFDSIYAQVGSILAQADALTPRPNALIAQLEQSLNVNGPSNYAALARAVTRAGQNTNTRNAEIAATAAADQGPNTESSGQVAVATGVATQAPALGATQVNDDGAIVATPTTAIPTNAFDPGSGQPVPTFAPPILPGTSSAAPVTPAGGPVSPVATQNALTPAPGQSEASQSYVYKATVVTSVFERGRFTQDIEGVLLIFSDPAVIKSGSTATQADSRLTDQTDAQSRRLQRQNNNAGTAVLATQANVPGILNASAAKNLAQQAQSSLPSSVTGAGLVDPSVLAPAIRNLPTSGGSQIGLFDNIVNNNVSGSSAPQQNIAREP
jgi:hypothetical protein